MAEREGISQEIGEALLRRAYRLFHWWHRVRDGTLDHELFVEAVRFLRLGLQVELEQAAQLPIAAGEKTPCTKLTQTWPAVFRGYLLASWGIDLTAGQV